MSELAHTPRLRRFAERVLAHPRSFALNVSNVRGPCQPVHVLEAPVCEFYSTNAEPEAHAIVMATPALSQMEVLCAGIAVAWRARWGPSRLRSG